MARRGESIFKRNDGRWEARYIKGRTHEGKAIYGYVYGKTYKMVKHKRLLKLTKQDVTEERHDIYFNEVARKWLLSMECAVRESTYAIYNKQLENHINVYFEGMRISQVNKEFIDSFIRNKLKDGRLDGNGGLSIKTVKELVLIIKQVINYGASINICPRVEFDVTLSAEKNKIKVLDNIEVSKIIKTCKDESLRCAILLALFCGLRVGEICALTVENFDHTDKSILISNTLSRIQDIANPGHSKVLISKTKTSNSTRRIPLPDIVSDSLMKVIPKEGFILKPKGGEFYEPRTLNYKLKKHLRICEVRQVSFHLLRHTFATQCIHNGFDYRTLSEILGHSSPSITMNVYVHSSYNLTKKLLSNFNY